MWLEVFLYLQMKNINPFPKKQGTDPKNQIYQSNVENNNTKRKLQRCLVVEIYFLRRNMQNVNFVKVHKLANW